MTSPDVNAMRSNLDQNSTRIQACCQIYSRTSRRVSSLCHSVFHVRKCTYDLYSTNGCNLLKLSTGEHSAPDRTIVIFDKF